MYCLYSELSASDIRQENDDQIITGYKKLIIGFQKCEFHNLKIDHANYMRYNCNENNNNECL